MFYIFQIIFRRQAARMEYMAAQDWNVLVDRLEPQIYLH